MKRIILVIIYVISNSLFSQNIFDANTQSVNHNSNFSIVIGLNNAIPVTAFQFDIDYNPNAFQLLNGHTLTSRAPNHIISVSNLDNDTLRVIVFSTSNQLIQIGNGAILNLFCKSKNLPGTYNLTFSNIVLSNQNGISATTSSINGSVTVTGPKYSLNTTNIEFGEIPIGSSPSHNITISNGGNTNLIISSYTLNLPFSIQNTFPIIVNAGATITIPVYVNTSVKQVVNTDLTFTTNDSDPLRSLQKTTIHADIFAVNEIYIGSGVGQSNTEITIPVSFSNMESFSGFQFDIALPNNVSFVQNSCVFTSRAGNHTIAANVINNNIIRFVAFSSTNASFSGNQGVVFSFKLIPNVSSGTYPLTISNPIISNVNLGDITSHVYNGSFSINAPALTTSVQVVNFGRVPINQIRTTQVSLNNTGSANLIIDQLVYNNNTLSFPLTLPQTITVGNSVSTNLVFTPQVLGLNNENISIRNNSPQQQKIINVIADVFSPNYLRIVNQSVYKNNSSSISLNLVNYNPIRGIQFDISFPTGFVFNSQNSISTSILNGFNVSVSSLGSNVYRFIIYTFSNNTISTGNQSILNLPIFVQPSVALGNYNFAISNVVLSSQTNQNIASEALLVGVITVIEDTTIPLLTLIGNSPVTIEVGSTYVDAGATAFDTYNGNITSSIIVTGSVNTNTIGIYTITYNVSDTSGNAAVTITRTVNVVESLGINNFQEDICFIYPNPTTSSWILQSTKAIEKVDVFDYTGKLILTLFTNATTLKIEADNLPSGIYIVRINTNYIKLIKK